MKQLSEVLNPIVTNVIEGGLKHNMPVDGSKNVDGRAIPPTTQQRPLITDREKLILIQSLMQRMKQAPQIEWEEIIDDEGVRRMRRIEKRAPVVITDEERAILAELSKPASRTVITYHVTRLASHKRTQDDPQMMTVVIKDFTDYLYAEGLKEYELYAAIDYFIAKDHSPFFPPLSQMMSAAKMAKAQGYIEGIK